MTASTRAETQSRVGAYLAHFPIRRGSLYPPRTGCSYCPYTLAYPGAHVACRCGENSPHLRFWERVAWRRMHRREARGDYRPDTNGDRVLDKLRYLLILAVVVAAAAAYNHL